MSNQTTFLTPYDQYADRHGQACTILGEAPSNEYDRDEVGVMFRVRFGDGEVIDAWPEEVGYDDNALRSVGINPDAARAH